MTTHPKNTILLVDDEPKNLAVLRSHLKEAGFRVLIAEDGESALRCADHAKPDLVLLDILLPGIDGFETCRRLKESAKTKDVPVLFMTVVLETPDKVRGFESGGVDYITKPFQVEEVLARVNAHLTIKNLQNHIEEQNARLRHEIAEREKTDEALRRSEQKFRGLVEGLNEVLFRMSLPDGRYEYVSPSARHVLGYPAEAFLENPLLVKEIIHPDFSDYFREKWAALVSGNVPPTYEYKIKDPEGGERWIFQSNRGVFDDDGNIIALEGLCKDITEQKTAETSLKRERKKLYNVLDTLPAYVYLQAPDYTIPFVNLEFRNLFGDPGGRTCYEILRERRDPCGDCPTLRVFETGKPVIWEWTANNGRTYMIYDCLFPDTNGSKLVLEIGMDITERKCMEEELKQARDAAEAANRAKTEFLGNMSHEFRTPLNSVIGFSQLMGNDPSLSVDYINNLAIIRRNGEHLLALINNMLDMSKIEAGKAVLNGAQFDLYRLLNDIDAILRPRAEKKGLALNFHCESVPQYVKTDESKLRRILLHLSGNAIKHTSRGEITVKVWNDPVKNDAMKLWFEITDTGPGIAPEDLEMIFEPFGRTKSSMELHPGVGLGLSISRKFVQLLGGDITAESDTERGTVFRFHIKCHPNGKCAKPETRYKPRAACPGPDRSESLARKSLNRMPNDLLHRLESASIALDADLVDLTIREISEIDKGLAQCLDGLANEFDYGEIVKMIRTLDNRS